jgi:hypothetical protein
VPSGFARDSPYFRDGALARASLQEGRPRHGPPAEALVEAIYRARDPPIGRRLAVEKGELALGGAGEARDGDADQPNRAVARR